MVEIDKTIYETFDDKCNTIRCRVCNKHIVKSYHKKHEEQKCHLNNIFINKYYNDDKLEELSKRVFEYNKLKTQANIMKKYIVKDLDEYREQNKPTENDYNSFVQQCKVNALVEELDML